MEQKDKGDRMARTDLIMPEPQTDEWLGELKRIFAECETREQLLEASDHIWTRRHCAGVLQPAVRLYRGRAKELGMRKESVTVVDFNSVFWCSFFSKSTPLQRFREIHKELSPEKWVMCADHEVNHRHEYEGYKQGRSDKPDEGYAALEALEKHMTQKGHSICKAEGLESDDLIASVVFKCQLLGWPCTIVSEDKDVWQCLGASTSIYRPKGRDVRTAQWLKATHKIEPKQVVDWLCITGKNDVPGIHGIGPSTASEWLEAYKDMIGIVDHSVGFTEKRREKVRDFYENRYWACRKIHTLSRQAPVTWQ